MEREKYFKQVLKEYDKELKGIQSAKNPGDISYHERQIRPLLIELQLAVPMLEEDIVKASRQRRRELNEA